MTKKLRYEMRPKGTPFELPMSIVEVDSEEELIEIGRKRLMEGHVTRPGLGRVTVEFNIVKRVEFRPVPDES